jgi:bacterioferritin (cytochrome b1)
MNRLPLLSDHELHATLLNALSCAADRYKEHARMCRVWGASENSRDLGDQFERQQQEAEALHGKLQEESEEA